MKTRIISLLIAFAITAFIMAITALSLDAVKGSLILILLVIEAGCVFLLMETWLSYIKSLLHNVSYTLNGNRSKGKSWSLQSLAELKSYHHAILRKFDLSALYISRLGHAEELEQMDDVIKNDKIGEAILRVQEEMRELKEDEDKRHWIMQGIAKFSEILRNKVEIKEYAHQIISNLVRYVDANQGALYIEYQSEEGDRYLEMAACYAFDKRKFLEDRIYEGQGMLGQCMVEKNFIFLTDIPQNYIKITSGLGDASPRNLIIAPLVFNEKFYGVIELALFEVMQPHQVEFVKRVSENIASEISSMRSYKQTQQFLEESKTLTHELQQREEEMRQNMEELMATQEQMARKQTELNSYLYAINNTIASAEFSLDGKFISANEIFLKVMGYGQNDLTGQRYNKIMNEDAAVSMMWENLKIGKFFSGEFKMRDKSGREVWLNGTFNPISTGADRAEKVMMFAQFANQEREKLHDLNIMVNALKATLPVVEFSDQFICKTANEKFIKMFGLSRLAMKDKTIYDFIDPYYKSVFEKIKDEILNKDFSTILLPIKKGDQTLTYEASVTVSQNLEGKTNRIIVILIKEVEDKVHVLTAV